MEVGSITISARTACMFSRTRLVTIQIRVFGRSYAPLIAARPRPFPLQADADSTHSGDMSYDGRFKRRGTPVQATLAGDSLCASERLDVAAACPKENSDGSHQ
jgi:hypothetical protein